MIDITTNEKDKDTFITKVALKENTDKFVVCFASGRVEERLFSVPNLNEAILTMEQQFLQYKQQYEKYSFDSMKKATIGQIVEMILAVTGIILTCALPIPVLLKFLIIVFTILCSLCYQREQRDIINEIKNNINTMVKAETFLQRKDDFKIRIIDPTSGLEEDWYLLTLSEIEDMPGPRIIDAIADTMTPDMREEESKSTTETLRKIMNLG